MERVCSDYLSYTAELKQPNVLALECCHLYDKVKPSMSRLS